MAGPVGIPPAIVMTPQAAALSAWLKPGLEIKGRIDGPPSNVSFVSGNRSVPLGPQAGLTAGQSALLQVVRGDAGLQLKLTILPTPSGAAAAPVTAGPLAIPLPPDLAAALPQQTATTGVVQRNAQGLSLLVQGKTIPLPPDTALQAGQAVQVKVITQQAQSFLTVTPEGGGGQAAQLPEILLAVLRALGTTAKPGSAQAMPQAILENAAALRQTLSLFVSRQPVGADLQIVAANVQQGVEAGLLPRSIQNAISNLLAVFEKTDPAGLTKALQQWAGSTDNQLEARIAQAMARGESDAAVRLIQESVRGQLAHVRHNEAFTTMLRERGQLDPFMGALDRVAERLSGAVLQNLHGTDQAYWFMEFPFDPSGPLQNAQIHVMGDGRRRGEIDPNQATIALDLQLSKIGPLWIQMTFRGGACSCLFRSADEDVRAAVQAQTGELQEALQQAGYGAGLVRVETWDEDRLGAVAALFTPTTKMDLNA